MEDADAQELSLWTPKLVNELTPPAVHARRGHGPAEWWTQSQLVIDRDTASRLGILPQAIDDTLYDAFVQRQVSHLYAAEPVSRGARSRSAVCPESGFAQELYVHAGSGTQVPLASLSHFDTANTYLAVNHQGQFPGRHPFVQPCAGSFAGRGDQGE